MVSIIKLRAFSVAVVLFLFTACKKDDGLTKETQTGANTFSCKINGQLFVAKGELFSPKSVYAEYYAGLNPANKQEYLIVEGSRFSPDPHITIHIKLNSKIEVGSHNLNDISTGQIEYRYIDGYNQDMYTTDATHTGEVTLTYVDHSSGIYAGRFSLTVIDSAGQTKQITLGRFDVKAK